MRHLPLHIMIAILFLCSFACAASTSTDIAELEEGIDFYLQLGDYMVSAERIMHSTNASSAADCRASQGAMQELLTGVRGLDLPSTDQSHFRMLRHKTAQALTLMSESLDPGRAASSRIQAAQEAQVLIDECAVLVERKRKEID